MKINNLPKNIAIFPLPNVIFFPQTILPLNIFEKRYVQLVEDCMKTHRLFGVIQPKNKSNPKVEVYKIGCLGKIVSFNETADKKFIISLSGITRFKIKEELNTNKLYREFEVDYNDFPNDLKIKEKENYKETDILKKIKAFFKKKNYLIQFEELNKLNFDQMISTICMISPFTSEEKQKLIEAVSIDNKVNVLEEIINLNLVDEYENKTIQ